MHTIILSALLFAVVITANPIERESEDPHHLYGQQGHHGHQGHQGHHGHHGHHGTVTHLFFFYFLYYTLF